MTEDRGLRPNPEDYDSCLSNSMEPIEPGEDLQPESPSGPHTVSTFDDPLARLRELAGGAGGRTASRFSIFVIDGRSVSKSGYAGRYHHLPDFDEIQNDFGGGLYAIKAADGQGKLLGDAVEIEILGPPKPPHEWRRLPGVRQAPHSAPATAGPQPSAGGSETVLPETAANPAPGSAAGGGLGEIAKVFMAGVTSLESAVKGVGAVVDKISAIPQNNPGALDVNKVLDLIVSVKNQGNPMLDSLTVLEKLDDMHERRTNPAPPDDPEERELPAPSGAERLAGSVANFLDHLRTKTAPATEQEKPGTVERLAGIPKKELEHAIDSLIFGFEAGWPAATFAEAAQEKIPPGYLTALQELGPRAVLALVAEKPAGQPFAVTDGAAQAWFYQAWRALFETGPEPIEYELEEEDEPEEEYELEEEDESEEPDLPPAADASRVVSQSDLIGDSSRAEDGPEE